MKKLFFIIVTGALLFSCSNTVNNNDSEKIQSQIRNYREQIAKLNDKIADLENHLNETGNRDNQANGIKVRVEDAKIQPFSEYFWATGELEAIDETFISPEVSGQIIALYIAEGQKVEEGQLLAKLDTRIIEKNINEIKTQLEYAEILYKKQQELWDKKIGSERQYLDIKNQYEGLKNKLETLKAQYNMSLIYSPINGYIEDIIKKKGELVTPGMQMMHIVGLDKLYATAMISESHLPVIHLNELVEITFPTYPGLILHEPVTLIGNVINKQNRTFKIKVEISNKNGKLKPNLLINIKINNYNSNSNIVIPSRIIREDMKGTYIYIAEKNSNRWLAKKIYINPGRSYRNKTEILSGITVGNKIITDGYSNISDGTILSIAG